MVGSAVRGARAASVWWLLALVPLFALGQRHALWGADEPREAEVAREMGATGDWVVPHLNGIPFLEKPPLAHWGAALVFGVLGRPSEEWCRLPSALWAAIGTAACAWLGGMLFDRRVGVLAAFVLVTSQEWLLDAHTLLVDPPLAAAVAGALAFFWYGYSSTTPRGKRVGYLLVAAASAAAFMAKGPIGVVLPGTAVLGFVAWRREWGELRSALAPVNVAAFGALVVPWLALLGARGGPGAFRTLFFENTLVRFFSRAADHAAPPWDYGPSLLGVMLPWSLYLPPVVAALARAKGLEGSADRRHREFLIAITAVPLLVLSLASAKRPVYLLPLMPGFAVAAAAWLAGRLTPGEPRWMRAWRAGGTFLLGLVALAGWGASVALAVRERVGLPAALIGLAGALVTTAAFARVVVRRRRTEHAVHAAGFALLACLSLLSPSTFRVLEARRGYGSLVAALSDVATPGTRVCGYGMGEREVGVVCFQRRATIPQVSDAGQLRRFLEAGDAVAVVSAEIVAGLRAAGRWPTGAEVVAAPPMPSRPFVLVRWRKEPGQSEARGPTAPGTARRAVSGCTREGRRGGG